MTCPTRRRSADRVCVVAGTDFRFEVEDIFARVRGLIDSGAPDGRDPRADRAAARADRRERAAAHVQGRGRADARLRPVLHAAAAGGPRGGAAPVGAPHLPRVERARAAQAADPLRRRPRRRWPPSSPSSPSTPSSPCCPSAGRCSRRVVGLAAVVMLFYVSFWLIARLDQRRRMEFLQARVWKAASVGSATSLALVGLHSPCTARASRPSSSTRRCSPSATACEAWILAGMAAGGRGPRRRGVGRAQARPHPPGEAVPHRGAGDRDVHVDRGPRQRDAGAAGGGHPRPALPRRLAEPADLPGPGHRLLPHAAERPRPGRSCSTSTSSAPSPPLVMKRRRRRRPAAGRSARRPPPPTPVSV